MTSPHERDGKFYGPNADPYTRDPYRDPYSGDPINDRRESASTCLLYTSPSPRDRG